MGKCEEYYTGILQKYWINRNRDLTDIPFRQRKRQIKPTKKIAHRVEGTVCFKRSLEIQLIYKRKS